MGSVHGKFIIGRCHDKANEQNICYFGDGEIMAPKMIFSVVIYSRKEVIYEYEGVENE